MRFSNDSKVSLCFSSELRSVTSGVIILSVCGTVDLGLGLVIEVNGGS